MIIKTKWIFKGFDAFTVWPFVFVRPEKAEDSALVAHELVHYKEQRRCLVLPWLVLYLLWPAFRLKAEVRAYQRQIALGGISIQGAAKLLESYRLNITQEEAEIALVHW